MFYNLRLSARWFIGSVSPLFWLWREQVASWYGYIGVPFIYAVYLLLPAFFIFLFSFVKTWPRTPGEANGAGRADYPVDDVVIAWVGAVIFPLLLFFLENRIV